TLPHPLVVTASGAGGTPLPDIKVTFAVASGGGSVSATSVTTNAQGQASTVLTLGPTAGPNTVTATVSGLTGSPVLFTATGKEPYEVTANPNPVAFGSIPINSSWIKTFTL